MFATDYEKHSSSPGDRSNLSAQNIRVLCCFADQGAARGYEQALTEIGFSLLRARHGMHAYWLAITAKPDLLVVDGRDIDIANDYLLGRLQQNGKLAKTPILVITHQHVETDPDVEAPLSLLAGNIVPSDLAARASGIIQELRHIQQQSVDAFFSDLNGDAQDFSPPSSHGMRRTDSSQHRVTARLLQETQRRRSKSIENLR